MGGSDQWGNITTGVELIRRKAGAEVFALTAPLVTKADGTKFGKSEGGNIWLDRAKTSPYKFYQFWLNTSDEDAARYIKLFTLLSQVEIETLIEKHETAKHLKLLQKELAKAVTLMVHNVEDYEMALEASEILFSKSTVEALYKLSEADFLEIFNGVDLAETDSGAVGCSITDLLVTRSGFLKSNNEARRALSENSISVNKQKVTEAFILTQKDLINGKYILLQRGKSNYFLLKIV
jgi:tyrosyl-tRNA synthetase